MKLNGPQEDARLASMKDQYKDKDGRSVDSEENRDEPAE